MKNYQVIIQVETMVSAKNQEQAEERADEVLDALELSPVLKKKRWAPEEMEKEVNSVTEWDN